MGDSAVTIVAIFLAAILMFVFPLMTMAEKQDDASKIKVQEATSSFVDKIRTEGKITQEGYDNFVLTLAATGNSYNPEITVQKADDNPAKKTSSLGTTYGDQVYYIMYTTQVLESLPMNLNEGDYVSVTVEKTNTTIGEQLKGFVYRISGNSSNTKVAESAGMVTSTAN